MGFKEGFNSLDIEGDSQIVFIDTAGIFKPLVAGTIRVTTDPTNKTLGFGIFYGVSDNEKRFWDISDAEQRLGYHPQDDASRYIANPKM